MKVKSGSLKALEEQNNMALQEKLKAARLRSSPRPEDALRVWSRINNWFLPRANKHILPEGLNSGTKEQQGKHRERNGHDMPNGRKYGSSDNVVGMREMMRSMMTHESD